MPQPWDVLCGGSSAALAVVDSVNADGGEPGRFGVLTAETYEPIAVLALTSTVTEKEQAAGAGRFVDARRNAAQRGALLVHVPTLPPTPTPRSERALANPTLEHAHAAPNGAS